MSVHIIRQSSVGYDEHGVSVYSTETFVKIETNFLHSGSLRRLKGAPLSVFICLALHEADDEPGASLSTIERETGYTSPTVIAAIRFLTEQRFIEELGTEDNGTKRYRVMAYAWFGSRPRRNGGGKKILPPDQKNFLPVVDDGTNSVSGNVQQQQQYCAAAKKFFRDAGVGEPALTKLSETVAVERAQMWRDWLSDPPKGLRNPVGYAIKVLSGDPNADPPGWTLAMWRKWCEDDAAEQERHSEARPEPSPCSDDDGRYYKDGADDVWKSVLDELKLQLTRETFDAWLRPSHALGWEDDSKRVLVVNVRSQYAKDWLEKRLYTVVQKSICGVVGRVVDVRFVE